MREEGGWVISCIPAKILDFSPSETPYNSSRGLIVVLVGGGVVPVHVVALQAPGEVLKPELIVRASADVDGDGIVDKAVRFYVSNAGCGVNKRAPFPEVRGQARAKNTHVLRDAGTIIAAGIEYETEVRKADEGEVFRRSFPTTIRLLVNDVCQLGGVRYSAVDISTRQELCRHRDREQHQTDEHQQRGGNLRHELFLPGYGAGKKFSFHAAKFVRCSVPDGQDVPVDKFYPS